MCSFLLSRSLGCWGDLQDPAGASSHVPAYSPPVPQKGVGSRNCLLCPSTWATWAADFTMVIVYLLPRENPSAAGRREKARRELALTLLSSFVISLLIFSHPSFFSAAMPCYPVESDRHASPSSSLSPSKERRRPLLQALHAGFSSGNERFAFFSSSATCGVGGAKTAHSQSPTRAVTGRRKGCLVARVP